MNIKVYIIAFWLILAWGLYTEDSPKKLAALFGWTLLSVVGADLIIQSKDKK